MTTLRLTRVQSLDLLTPGRCSALELELLLAPVELEAVDVAVKRLRGLCRSEEERGALAAALPIVMSALTEAAAPDASLVNFERYVERVPDRRALLRHFTEEPRSVEILFKLFVGSQFLTEILLRNPGYLDALTQHRKLAEMKSRGQFVEEGAATIPATATYAERLNAIRRFQQWELLRIAACDTLGLVDLKLVTLQLSLLTDAICQLCLQAAEQHLNIQAKDFCVLAFGKLGGEELNYSSDIDLVFVTREAAERYWGLGQQLIRSLSETTECGFLYRVDMRLRPWGSAGALVTTIESYISYLRTSGKLWEKQALLKARPIAGNLAVGFELLKRLDGIIFNVSADEVRVNVADMKSQIEQKLGRSGRLWGQVKGGRGGIRDVEFLTQYLQLAHGEQQPMVRSSNTLDGLVRLADCDFIQASEYRHLSSGYVFLRYIEHALQIMHNKQEHALPDKPRELDYLARRLDFMTTGAFVAHYEQHCLAIREVFEKYIHLKPLATVEPAAPRTVEEHLGTAAPSYHELFTDEQAARHLVLLEQLSEQQLVMVEARRLMVQAGQGVGERERQSVAGSQWELTIVGYDSLGDLSLMSGLLLAYGLNIASGDVFTGAEVGQRKSVTEPASSPRKTAARERRRRFVNVFTIHAQQPGFGQSDWQRYTSDLCDVLRTLDSGQPREAHGIVIRRVAQALENTSLVAEDSSSLLPVEITVDNAADPEATVLHIRGEDTLGFLFELTNSLSMCGIAIQRVFIRSDNQQVVDTLYVTDKDGHKITNASRLNELRAAIVLIKHFTHLLPQSPNPESALLHFQGFLEQLFQQPDWVTKLGPLHRSQVLGVLARLLGVSDFLWDDFLRLQHDNLFPVVTNIEGLQKRRTIHELAEDLERSFLKSHTLEAKREALNSFKDREMLRVDLRHILGLQAEFGEFSRELTDIAEVVVAAALGFCENEISQAHGLPTLAGGQPCPLAVCALGKCGGSELGFASDIELLFLYADDGQTTVETSSSRSAIAFSPLSNIEYFDRLVGLFRDSIHAKRKGIFEVDLRLRPYGKAGSLAVSLASFEKYFAESGPAWPYERQALVKLRPIAGDETFGRTVVSLRDRLIYTGTPFDVAAMRAMRQKQISSLVQPGTFNAKLSSGGLVDIEYLIQGLQITYGHTAPDIRDTNTREAMKALEKHGILDQVQRLELREAYRFFRRLIDALRMVRGDAQDLTIPPMGTDQFQFLTRRLRLFKDSSDLLSDLETYTESVRRLAGLLDT